MTDNLLPKSEFIQPVLYEQFERIGKAANEAASLHSFNDYKMRRAHETLRRQQADLALFNDFLSQHNITIEPLFESPAAWRYITWGLVEGFSVWQLQQGYALTSINVRLSTVKAYSRLALKAGTLSQQEYVSIKALQSYTHKEQRKIDQNRPVTRIGRKKVEPVIISLEQARLLKTQPNTPQGRRDALLMCLLLDHGLRVGEVSLLQVENFNLDQGLLQFYRPKVGKEQTHRLSKDTLRAVSAYQNYHDMPPNGPLLRQSKKNHTLTEAGMTERGITLRVKVLGEEVGLAGLSAHDCRHYWATNAARHGTDPFVLQEAGGWASLAMPRRYIEDNEISNDGLIIDT